MVLYGIMAGIMLLVYSTAGEIIMTVLFPLWFIAHCISRLAHLHDIRLFSGDFTYYFTLILNIMGLILGTLMLVNRFSLLSIRYIVSFYLLLGIDCIIPAVSRMGRRF